MTYATVNGSPLLLPSSLTESYGSSVLRNQREPFTDDPIPMGASPWQYESDQYDRAGFETEEELKEARRIGRYLYRKSAYARSAHDNRQNYIVSWGHVYKVAKKKGVKGDYSELIRICQAILDDFCRRNKWPKRQRETVLRRDRDGEAFLRLFDTRAGLVARFIEPSQVYTPPDKPENKSHIRMGVQLDKEDAETREAYWVDGQAVDAARVQHRRGCVDANVPRGCPLLWTVVDTLRAIPRIRTNMAAGSAIQTEVAYAQKMRSVTKDGATKVVEARNQKLGYACAWGANQVQSSRRGLILTHSDNIEYEFPFARTNYAQYVDVIADNLREIAAFLVMPEWMLTSNSADMAAYTAAWVAESHSVKNFECLQNEQIEDDLEILWLALELGAKLRNIDADLQGVLEIECEPPAIVARNELNEIQALKIERDDGIISAQTWCQRRGYDYDQEQQNINQHEAAYGGRDAQENQILANNRLLSPQKWSARAGLDYEQEQKNIEEHEMRHPGASLPLLGFDAPSNDGD